MKTVTTSGGSGSSVTHWRFTVEDVLRMAEAGILAEDDRVELIEGELLAMPPIGERHAWIVTVLTDLLTAALGRSAFVSVQNPLRLSDESAPQPDLAVLRRRPEGYGDRYPEPADVLLVIEVADTTLDYDCGVKVPLYARAGLAEVWIVNLAGEAIERYADPHDGRYRHREILKPGETIQARLLPLALAVRDILA